MIKLRTAVICMTILFVACIAFCFMHTVCDGGRQGLIVGAIFALSIMDCFSGFVIPPS